MPDVLPPPPKGFTELPPPPKGFTEIQGGGSATSAQPGKWLGITPDQIQGVRDRFFNTDNRNANAVIAAADAYSRNPNDPKLRQQILSMHPITQAAILEKAKEFRSQDAQNADMQMHVNPYTAPVFTSKSTGKIVQPNEAQGLSELLHGPEGARKLQKSKKFGPTLQKALESAITPSGISTLGTAGLVSAAFPPAGPLIVGAFTGQMGGQGVNSLLSGNTEEGLANLAMAGAPYALGMFKGLKKPAPPEVPSPTEGFINSIEQQAAGRTMGSAVPEPALRLTREQIAQRKQDIALAKATLAQSQKARTEILRLQQMLSPEPLSRPGPVSVGPEVGLRPSRIGATGRGASPVAPTLPAMSPVDTSQPLFGAEGPPRLGQPPFKTTYQQLTPPPTPPQEGLAGPSTPAQAPPSLPVLATKPKGNAKAAAAVIEAPPEVAPAIPPPAKPPVKPPATGSEPPTNGKAISDSMEWVTSGLREKQVVPVADQVLAHLRGGERVMHTDKVFGDLPLDARKQILSSAKTAVKSEVAPKGSGTLNMGFGPTGNTGEEPLITAEKVKRLANSLGVDNLRDLASPINASEGLKRVGDRARALFVEGGSYTNRVAPDMMRKTIAYDNAPQVTKASVEKISDTLEGLPQIGSHDPKDLFQRMINADKQVARGVPITDPAINEADLRAYASHPQVQKAVASYNKAVGEVYGPLREAAGYGQNNLYGKYLKAWSPSISEEHMNSAGGGPSAPGSKALFVPNKVQGEVQFTGRGKYLQSLEGSHEFRLGGLTRASGQRQVLAAGMKEGVVKPVPEGFDGTMLVRGKSEPAMRVKLSDLGLGPRDLEKAGLPEEVIMPKQVVSDISPAFEKSKAPFNADEPQHNMLKRVMQAYLYSTGELGAHGITLPSIAGSKVQIKTGMQGLDAVLNAVGPTRQALRMKDMVRGTKFSAEEISDARVLAAKAGVYRDNPLAGTKTLAEKAKVVAGSPGTSILYGKRGAFNNIVTGMVKTMKAQGKSEAEIVDALRVLPNRSGSFVPRFQDTIERIMGPGFYSTGKAALRAGYSAMTPKNILGALAFYTLVGQALDEDGKSWYDRGIMPGEFVRGKDKDGTPMKWDLATLDRLFRVQREVPGKVSQEAAVDIPNDKKGRRVAETAAIALFNQLIRPAATGPTASLVSQATGVAPYAVKSSDNYAAKPLNTPTASQDYISKDRLWAMLGSLVPGSQTMLGDVNENFKTNTPVDEKLILINRILRTLGQKPGVRYDENATARNAARTEFKRMQGAARAGARAGSR